MKARLSVPPVVLAALALLNAGCGAPSPAPTEPAATGAPAAGAPSPPSGPTVGEASPQASNASPTAEPNSDDTAGDQEPREPTEGQGEDTGARGPHWTAFPGPVVKKQITSRTVWAAVPLSDEWDVLALFLVDRVRADGNEQVVKLGERELWVPNALASPPTSGVVQPGAPVLVQLYGSLSAQYGRVVKASGEKVTVKSVVIKDVEEVEVEAQYVVPLRGAVAFGESAAYETFADHWTTGIVLHPGPGTAWMLPSTGIAKDVDATKVKPMAVTKRYTVGAKVLAENAASGGWLHPGVVKAVVNDGLQYRIAFDKGGEELRGFEVVTARW